MEETILDASFIADPDADEEMGTDGPEAIADEDLKGSRLLLVKRVIEPIDIDGAAGGVVQFACAFQPAAGTRFVSAQLRLRLKTPQGTKIIDLAPRSVDDPHPVEFTLNKKGQLGIKYLSVEPGGEIGSSKKFVKYHCKIQGTGEGTSLARWDFKENPDSKAGIGPDQVLTVTLPVTGKVSAEVIVSARLVKTGVKGKLEAIRDLILGTRPGERYYPVSFEVPEQVIGNGVSWFATV